MSKELLADKAIRTLAALGYAYIIRDPAGQMFTNGEVTDTKRRTARPEYADYTPYLHSQGLGELQVGDVMVTDGGGRDISTLRSRASAYASQNWGKGNHTISTGDGKLTLLRLG